MVFGAADEVRRDVLGERMAVLMARHEKRVAPAVAR